MNYFRIAWLGIGGGLVAYLFPHADWYSYLIIFLWAVAL